MSNSVRPHRRQPTRLPSPWDSPGKNTGVGCHFLLQCRKVKSESEVAQSCPTLSDPMDCSPPGSSIHGIFQARVLEWGAIAFSASYFLGSSNKRQSFKPELSGFPRPSLWRSERLQKAVILLSPDLCLSGHKHMGEGSEYLSDTVLFLPWLIRPRGTDNFAFDFTGSS